MPTSLDDPLMLALRQALTHIADSDKRRWAICVVFDLDGDDLKFLYANTHPEKIPDLLRAAANMHNDGERVPESFPAVN